jgi:hypothetical protein
MLASFKSRAVLLGGGRSASETQEMTAAASANRSLAAAGKPVPSGE